MKRMLALLLLLSAFSACAASPQEPEATPRTTPAATPVCRQGGPWAEDGEVDVEPGAGGADSISALRWDAHDGCERFVVDLGAGEAGRVEARVIREAGVVRIDLPGVTSVDPAHTEARYDGPLARGAYVVTSDDGGNLFVDLHLASAAEVSVRTLGSPGRIVIDLRPGGGPVPPAAATSDRVVVLQPRAGAAAYPLTVSGYSRTFEANVVHRLEQGGREVSTGFTTATSWSETWGWYAFTIDRGPTGDVTLHVGEESAEDGTWEGAEVALSMR